MTVKGRLTQLNSKRNTAVVRIDHGSDPDITYHGEMQNIAKKPRKWFVKAAVLLGAKTFTADSALGEHALLHIADYDVPRCNIHDAVARISSDLREDMGKSKPTHSIQLIINVNTD